MTFIYLKENFQRHKLLLCSTRCINGFFGELKMSQFISMGNLKILKNSIQKIEINLTTRNSQHVKKEFNMSYLKKNLANLLSTNI